ncbi:MAG TPA: polysaccharide biosynthesis protein [Actinomycetes bacterium]|nr:polysaccharide biosynthesis protein [Actinomycetes bacterium]
MSAADRRGGRHEGAPSPRGTRAGFPGPLRAAALLVLPAMLAGNAVGYLFTVIAARQLGPAAYGALGGLLGVVIALAVPGIALQAVVARRAAVRGRDGLGGAPVVRLALWSGAALALPACAAAPLVAGWLRLGSLGPALWLAANLAPLPLLFAVSGLLQGRQRFGALAAVMLVAAAGKLPLGVALVAAGYGVDGALAGVAAGTLAAGLLGLAAAGHAASQGAGAAVGATHALARELAAAGLGVLGLVALTNLDVLLARHYLPAAASGLYAAGAVVAKVAYWAPLAAMTVVFPRLALAAGRGALLRRTALATLAFGALCVAGAAAMARWPALLPFGGRYLAVGPDLPLFAALGTAFALAQLLLFADIAARRRRGAWPVAVAACVEALLVAAWFHHSVTEILLAALASSAALLLAAGRVRLAAAAEPVPGGAG